MCENGLDLDKTKNFPAFLIIPDGSNFRVDGGKSGIVNLTILVIDHCPNEIDCPPVPIEEAVGLTPLEWAVESMQTQMFTAIKTLEALLTDKAKKYIGDGVEYCYSVVADWEFIFDCLSIANQSSYAPTTNYLTKQGYCGVGINYSFKGNNECILPDYSLIDMECFAKVRAIKKQEQKQKSLNKGLPKVMFGDAPSESAVKLNTNNFPIFFSKKGAMRLLDSFKKSPSEASSRKILALLGRDSNRYRIIEYNQLFWLDKK